MALIPIPSFCLYRGAFIRCAIAWDAMTGIFTRVEGPDAFTTWDEAEEASRFLCPLTGRAE